MRRKIHVYIFNFMVAAAIATPICGIAAESRAKTEPTSTVEIESVEIFIPITKVATKPTEKATEHETTIAETESEKVEFTPYGFIPLGTELQQNIKDLCDSYGFSYDLCLAIIKTESEFQTDIIGDHGQAVGLCQIWPK